MGFDAPHLNKNSPADAHHLCELRKVFTLSELRSLRWKMQIIIAHLSCEDKALNTLLGTR